MVHGNGHGTAIPSTKTKNHHVKKAQMQMELGSPCGIAEWRCRCRHGITRLRRAIIREVASCGCVVRIAPGMHHLSYRACPRSSEERLEATREQQHQPLPASYRWAISFCGQIVSFTSRRSHIVSVCLMCSSCTCVSDVKARHGPRSKGTRPQTLGGNLGNLVFAGQRTLALVSLSILSLGSILSGRPPSRIWARWVIIIVLL